MFKYSVSDWTFEGPLSGGPAYDAKHASMYGRPPFLYMGTFLVCKGDKTNEQRIDVYANYPKNNKPMLIAITANDYNGFNIGCYEQSRDWGSSYIYGALGMFQKYFKSDEFAWWPFVLAN